MNTKKILSRLYSDYSKKFLKQIFFAGFFSILVAGGTSAIAWLLDPAIEKIFIEKDQTLIIIIPILIIIAFATKGLSLYFAKTIMISVGEEVKKMLQSDMLKSFIEADTQFIENKHTGKYVSNLTYDVGMITNLLTNALLNLFKEVIDHQNNVRSKIHKQITEMGIETYINDTSSEWIGMNILSLDPNTVVVDKRQTQLIESLEKNKFDVIRINFRHSYFMGGIHCSTLDTVRKSQLESYFD